MKPDREDERSDHLGGEESRDHGHHVPAPEHCGEGEPYVEDPVDHRYHGPELALLDGQESYCVKGVQREERDYQGVYPDYRGGVGLAGHVLRYPRGEHYQQDAPEARERYRHEDGRAVDHRRKVAPPLLKVLGNKPDYGGVETDVREDDAPLEVAFCVL